MTKIAVKAYPTLWILGDDNAFWCGHQDYEIETVECPRSIDPIGGELVSDTVEVAICTDCGEDITEEVL